MKFKAKVIAMGLLVVSAVALLAAAFMFKSGASERGDGPGGREGRRANRLIGEKSPYLLQHAYNPVDWYPWGEEAFKKAREENKPIFLSVGYSTCHWCHVMERESFSNQEIAAILNKNFIAVKVDREERPDVDRIYMTFVQATTGSGGWPMSVWLTPDLKPFFGGTYFPPDDRYGRAGFKSLLLKIVELWQKERSQILASADKVTEALKHYAGAQAVASPALEQRLLERAYQQIKANYDARHGGFGGAPKFPRPVVLTLLFRYYARTGEKPARDMALHTLRAMAMGGVRDHLGGGFHRYSVDGQWRTPHFEKMLYDQAQLASSYLEAYQITKEKFYADTVREILEYLLRDMAHEEGGFYSAEDADSFVEHGKPEHAEGAFYVWTRQQVREVLGAETAEVFSYHFGIEEKGNALSDPQGELTGKNILYIARSLDETAKKFNKSAAEVAGIIEAAKKKLFAARAARPRPHLDDKIITAWNGLAISAFARAYQVLGEERYLAAAERAAAFVSSRLYSPSSTKLSRHYRNGAAEVEGFLDDYAFFVQGLLDLYEAGFDIKWLSLAIALTETQNRLFWDAANGGYFNTSGRDGSILFRMKDDFDGAEPAANSVALLNLGRLAEMTDNKQWREMAEKGLRLFAGRLQQGPEAMPLMLAALDFHLDKPKQIIIAGKRGAPDTGAMLRALHEQFIPNKIILLADGGAGQELLARYLPFIRGISTINGKAAAYICENYTCKLPTTEIAEMSRQLRGRS